uniref:C-type lectin domain-containing protein n=1 Tax=Monodelphis domestica TaxID=13616 RepID=F6UJA1_MONDO
MKFVLILSLALLRTVSCLLLSKFFNSLPLFSPPILSEELEMPEKGEVLTSVDNSFEKEKEETTELVPAAKEKNTLCPKEEDTVYVPGKPGLQTDKYVLGRALKTFTEAQKYCQKKFKGNLVSIHSYYCNYKLQHLIAGINQGQVWIGLFLLCLFLKGFWKKFRWTDGSSWNFSYWAIGQPFFGWGRCVALGKNGSWRRSPCLRPLPFICSL